MTPTLRKRHQKIWWFLGVVLVLFWGSAMFAINKNNAAVDPPKAIGKTPGYSVTLQKGDSNKSQKISIEVQETIPSPQTLVYLAPDKNTTIAHCQLLGRIDGKGTYVFELDTVAAKIPHKVVKGYDAIHRKEIFISVIN